MRKFSLLLGALGGGVAGYLFSNKKLRDELVKAKDAEQAARTLGRHLQQDGQKLGQQVREFIESEDVQKHVTKVRQFAKEKVEEAKRELQSVARTGASRAKATMKGKASLMKQATGQNGKVTVSRAKEGRSRVHTKTRKLS